MKTPQDTTLVEQYQKLSGRQVIETPEGKITIVGRKNNMNYKVAIDEMKSYVNAKLEKQQRATINLSLLIKEKEKTSMKAGTSLSPNHYKIIQAIAKSNKVSVGGLARIVLKDIVSNNKYQSLIDKGTKIMDGEGKPFKQAVCSIKPAEYRRYSEYAKANGTKIGTIIKLGFIEIIANYK